MILCEQIAERLWNAATTIWNSTQPVATRPLAIQKDGTWHCYGWDMTKNICEAFKTNGGIGAAYTYTPYGAVTSSGSVTQPLQWSSEYADEELGLAYYNYRHYNPMDGRWMRRDAIGEMSSVNIYCYVDNSPLILNDFRGNSICCDKCERIGVTQANVIISITLSYGSPEMRDSFNTFAKIFKYTLKGSEKVFSPIKIVSKVYGSTVDAASKFFYNRSRISNDKGWVVHGKIQYTVCEYKNCWLFWKNKDLTNKETKWVRSEYILPGQYQDAEWEVKRKLEKELKRIEGK